MMGSVFCQTVALLCVLLFGAVRVESAKTLKTAADDSEKSGSDIIPSHNTRFSSPTASSYYGYQMSPSSFRQNYVHSPLLTDPYERVAREYASASSNIGYAASAPDLVSAAGGHGGGGHGGGHGWHSSHGHGNGGYTKVNNSGLGLLGLLGLLSLLQGVLAALASAAATTTTMAAAGRKFPPAALSDSDYDVYEFKSKQKRSIRDTGRTDAARLSDKITRMVLPSLNVVAHARDGNIPLNCTHHEVCRTSNILMQELGENGHLVGYRLSEAIASLLKDMDDTGTIRKTLDSASTAGLNGLNCHNQYPMCKEMLKSNGAHAYPPIMLGTPYGKENVVKPKP